LKITFIPHQLHLKPHQ